jgi:hypothetical protein
MNNITRVVLWSALLLGHLLAMALLAWHLLAQFSFAYPTGYKLLSLDKHIQEFAGTNRHKEHFELVENEEHWNLFSQIATAVQSHGKGLATISYKLPDGSSTPLMHAAEVTHLQDVANLIDVFYTVGIAGALAWLILLYVVYQQKIPFPSIKKILQGFCGGALLLVALIFGFGAKKIFYWLHTKVFPEGHQWFFYYDESLMTTLMKAPDIFAFIGLLLAILLVVFWLSSVWAMNKLLTYKAVHQNSQPVTSHGSKKKRKK